MKRRPENIATWQDRINNESRIFIIGTGSSLNEIPHPYWSQLRHEEVTIGINESFLKFIPDYLIWADTSTTVHIKNFFNDRYKWYKPIYLMRSNAFDNVEPGDEWLDKVEHFWDETKLEHFLTSLYLLQLLKDYQGEIYLIGFDFYGQHFYSEFPDHYQKHFSYDIGQGDRNNWIFQNFDESIKLHEKFNHLKIFNCNEKSYLTKYDFRSIDKVL